MSYFRAIKNNKFFKVLILSAIALIFLGSAFNTALAQGSQSGDTLTGDTPAVDNYCVSWTGGSVGGCLLLGISWILSWVQWVFLFVLQAAVWLFEFAVDASIKEMSTYANMDGVLNAWKILRDLTNMMFLLVMMYMAIGTVLQLDGVNWQRMIGTIIVAAIMINFSMAITKIVIDSSNVFALYFYNQAKGGEDGKGIPRIMFDNMQMERVVAKQKPGGDSQQANASDGVPSALAIVVNTIGSILVILLTSYVLLVAGFLFITRLVTLIFAMIFSPLPWLGMVLPKFGSKLSAGYWDSLLNQAFFAPAYTFCIYFVMKIISCTSPSQIAASTGGGYALAGSMPLLMYYVIVISLMFGSIIVAKKMGAEGMSAAQTAAKWTMGGLTGAGIAATRLGTGTFSGAYRGLATPPPPGTNRVGNVFREIGTNWSKTSGEVQKTVSGAYAKVKESADKSPLQMAGSAISAATGVSILPGSSDLKGLEKARREAGKESGIEDAVSTINDLAGKATLTSDEEKTLRDSFKKIKGDDVLKIDAKALNSRVGEFFSSDQHKLAKDKGVEEGIYSKDDIKSLEQRMASGDPRGSGRKAVEGKVANDRIKALAASGDWNGIKNIIDNFGHPNAIQQIDADIIVNNPQIFRNFNKAQLSSLYHSEGVSFNDLKAVKSDLLSVNATGTPIHTYLTEKDRNWREVA